LRLVQEKLENDEDLLHFVGYRRKVTEIITQLAHKFLTLAGLRANHESIEIFSVNGEMHENSIKKNQVHLTWKNLNVSVPSSKSLTGKQQSPKKYILNGGESFQLIVKKFFF